MNASTATAVVFEKPGVMALRSVGLMQPAPSHCVVDMLWSGISTGTERLLWDGRMPPFPGLTYPLVPGYESVGRVSYVGDAAEFAEGQLVFVPGSPGYTDVSGLFGATADRVVVEAERLVPIDESLGEQGTLLALAATAHHCVTRLGDGQLPELIVGHGVLGRLVARCVLALGGKPPVVWEASEARKWGAQGYEVLTPERDGNQAYQRIIDVSGDPKALDTLISRLAPRGSIVLAGFYHEPLSFAFPAAFMREASIVVAAEWQRADLDRVLELVNTGALSLDGLISHHQSAEAAAPAYRQAFGDPECLKMVLEWRSAH
ncbi:MAG: chlorophyll synthesis pathway protein BchC [Pseudomonadota bacterium]